MIKTTVIPHNNNYNLVIPDNYIGKKIEILFYSLDEIIEEKSKEPPKETVIVAKKTMADFCGILSESEYLSIKEHTEQARKEWNRNI